MAVVALLAKTEELRRELKLALEELGHLVAAAQDIPGVLETVSRQRPRLLVVACAPEETLAESALASLEREAPLVPVIVALTERRAARAVELLKAGAYEVLCPPFTASDFSPAVSKALRFRGTAFEPSRIPEPRARTGFYAALGLGLLLTVWAASSFKTRTRLAELQKAPLPPTEFDLPYEHPAGMAFNGKELWISDWYSQTIHRHEVSGMRVINSRHLPQQVPGALAFAGDALYAASGPRGFARHLLDERLTVLSWIKDHKPQTMGLAYDGLYLWSCDSVTRSLHKRIPDESLTVVESFSYPGTLPAALAFDGKSLWSIDAGNRELLRHDLLDPSKIKSRVPLGRYRLGNWKPTGLVFDGRRFLSAAEHQPRGDAPGKLFIHEIPEDLLAEIRGR